MPRRLDLTTTIGNGLPSAEKDIIKTRKVFNLIEEESGGDESFVLFDKKLDTTIRNFQKDNDLKQDGIMGPGGETERAVNNKLEEDQKVKVQQQQKDEQHDAEFEPMNGQAVPVDLPISLMGGVAAKATGKFAKDANKFLRFLMKRGAAHEAEKQEDKLLEKVEDLRYDLKKDHTE